MAEACENWPTNENMNLTRVRRKRVDRQKATDTSVASVQGTDMSRNKIARIHDLVHDTVVVLVFGLL
jgi:hypothetical protein